MLDTFKRVALRTIRNQVVAALDGSLPMMGAAALDADDSSDSEDDVQALALPDAAVEVAAPPPRRARFVEGSWVKIDLVDYALGTLDVSLTKHAYVMYIKLNPDDVRTVINVCRFFGNELDEYPVNECLSPADSGAILWSHPRHAFKVLHFRRSLPSRKTCKTFKVERRGRAGNEYSTAEIKSEMNRVVATCRLFWNAADESGAPRLPVSPANVFDEDEVLGS